MGRTLRDLTDNHVDAALCIWEYALHCRISDDDSVYDWLRGGEGAASARQQCIELCEDCDKSYQIAVALGYDTCFDWEFVPRWVREAMRLTEKHDLDPWIDYIGRKIFDRFDTSCSDSP